MNDKILYQFSISILVFFGLWYGLSQINFTQMLKIEELSRAHEEKLGELIYDVIKKTNQEISEDSLVALIDRIRDRICRSNNIDPHDIKIHILKSSDVNAFALPDKRLVLYSGLIDYCRNAEELSGVIAHEIAHMEHNHIMQKLTKEVGIAMLVTMAGGSSSSEIIKETLKIVSSTSFDRKQEIEADESAVEYMANANIDPEHFANLLFRFSHESMELPRQIQWMSTHPNSKDRAAEVLLLRREKTFVIEPI
jgi:beta-barrel assembly-enhancing protease